jgi:hypothetical protein
MLRKRRRGGWFVGSCVEAARLALSVGTVQALDQNQKPQSAGTEARGRGRLGALNPEQRSSAAAFTEASMK